MSFKLTAKYVIEKKEIRRTMEEGFTFHTEEQGSTLSYNKVSFFFLEATPMRNEGVIFSVWTNIHQVIAYFKLFIWSVIWSNHNIMPKTCRHYTYIIHQSFFLDDIWGKIQRRSEVCVPKIYAFKLASDTGCFLGVPNFSVSKNSYKGIIHILSPSTTWWALFWVQV